MDMLVKLYQLPMDWGFLEEQKSLGITVRKPIGPEKHTVVSWVKTNFSDIWASEADVAFSNWPMSVFIATFKGQLIGFTCYDATGLGYFGPIGVLED